MRRIGIHQSYLFPYKGYFDLIKSVDIFVLYDDAQYIKGGWINRNCFPEPFTFRLKKHSNYDKINQLYFFDIEKDKIKFKKCFPKLNHKYLDTLKQEDNLAVNIHRTIIEICKDLNKSTPIYSASEIKHGKFVKGMLDMIRALGGDTYINAPGGRKLYTQEMFGDIKLEFLDTVVGPSILCEL